MCSVLSLICLLPNYWIRGRCSYFKRFCMGKLNLKPLDELRVLWYLGYLWGNWNSFVVSHVTPPLLCPLLRFLRFCHSRSMCLSGWTLTRIIWKGSSRNRYFICAREVTAVSEFSSKDQQSFQFSLVRCHPLLCEKFNVVFWHRKFCRLLRNPLQQTVPFRVESGD